MPIEIDFDVGAFEAQADAVVEQVVEPALIDAVNATARAVRIAAVTAMPSYIGRPTPFTLAGIGMLPANGNPDAPHGLEALVSIMPIQAQYMQYQILGGTRARATTPRRPRARSFWAPTRGSTPTAICRGTSSTTSSQTGRSGSISSRTSRPPWCATIPAATRRSSR